MERNKYQELVIWKNSNNRKPLLVFGARQVGKSYILKQFAENEFENYLYIDFEETPYVKAAFENSLEPDKIVKNLERLFSTTIHPQKSLLVFDEIQASNRALTSLKYFCEQIPELHVVAAGSHLGISVAQNSYSAPVGKVDIMNLYPMTFDEMLVALGKKSWLEELEDSLFSQQASLFHEQLLEYVYVYMSFGGMPEAVFALTQEAKESDIRSIQSKISELYTADMAKYATPMQVANIRQTWESIPRQLAKENKKFMYKHIRSGARASTFAYALDWLQAASLIYRSNLVSSVQLPLAMHEDVSAFKIFPLDIGLLSRQLGLSLEQLIRDDIRKNLDLGGLCEAYVADQLKAQDTELHYWTSNNTAEIDFLVEGLDKAIPIEVKSSTNTRSKSLHVYCDKYRPDIAVRISPKAAGVTDLGGTKLIACPLYALHLLPKLIKHYSRK